VEGEGEGRVGGIGRGEGRRDGGRKTTVLLVLVGAAVIVGKGRRERRGEGGGGKGRLKESNTAIPGKKKDDKDLPDDKRHNTEIILEKKALFLVRFAVFIVRRVTFALIVVLSAPVEGQRRRKWKGT